MNDVHSSSSLQYADPAWLATPALASATPAPLSSKGTGDVLAVLARSSLGRRGQCPALHRDGMALALGIYCGTAVLCRHWMVVIAGLMALPQTPATA